MHKAISRGGSSLGIAVVAIGIVFVAGMRAKSRPVLDTVRKLGRATRPLALRSAGTAGSSTSVIHHVGRTSGRRYETPVVAVPTDDGYLVALPYGPDTDWLMNVLASGSAGVAHDGGVERVDHPEIVPLETVNRHFSPADQRAHRLFGVEQGVLLRRTPASPETTAD